MRKLILIIASIFTALGVVFVFLPLGTLGLLPIVLAIALGYVALRMSAPDQQQFPKILLLFSVLSLATVLAKEAFMTDEVVNDQTFEQTKIQSEKEAQKELEEIEELEGIE